MNNAQLIQGYNPLTLEEKVDDTTLRERMAELVRIIEALQGIKQSAEWSTLKTLVFDSLTESLEKRLKSESEQMVINVPHLNHLQGQLLWARKYANLDSLQDAYKLELSHIKKLTQPTER